MTKGELLALGLPEERVKEFQEIYHRDVRKAARLLNAPDRRADELRSAVSSMLSALSETESLRAILAAASQHYVREYQGGAAAGDDGGTEGEPSPAPSAAEYGAGTERTR